MKKKKGLGKWFPVMLLVLMTVAAVATGIHAAGVDVLIREPYHPDDRLLTLDHMIVTPHNAALNTETMNKMGLDAARGIDEVLSGQTPSWPVSKF